MKPRNIIILAVIVTTAFLIWLHFREVPQRNYDGGRTSESSSSSVKVYERPPGAFTNDVKAPIKDAAEQLKREIAKRHAMEQGKQEWRTPIEFYGKVVDENSNGVPGAEIHLVWTDLSERGNDERRINSDSKGMFSLQGVQGKTLTVRVTKEGYYAYKPFPVGFTYAGDNQNFVPDARQPVIFMLKRRGHTVPLVHVSGKYGIPKNGEPVLINLVSGSTGKTDEAAIRIECWTDDAGKTGGQKYDWKCRVSAVGGGVRSCTNELNFEAPQDGYQVSDTIEMRVTDENWSRFGNRQYFIKFDNGTYARLSFQMVAFNDHFCKIDSYWDRNRGRNLEFDPDTNSVTR